MKKLVLLLLTTCCLSFLGYGQSISLDYSFNPTCNGGANGGFCLSNNGFLGTINYTLSPGGATNSLGCFNYLAAGTYTINAVDSFSNSASTTVTLLPATSPSISSITQVPCTEAANVSVSGGTGPYNVVSVPAGWYNPSSQTIYFGSGNGNYTITVIDANGCTATSVFNLNYTPNNMTSTRSFPNTNCTSATFELCETVSGGAPPYTYSVNTTTNSTGCFTGLNFLTYYSVVITDNNGCSIIDSLSLDAATPQFTTNLQNPSTCAANDGSICITNPQMATAPYQYAINSNAPQSSNCFSNLNNGVYTVTIIDANNCSSSQIVTIMASSPYGYTTTLPTPCNATTGEICVNSVFGGTPPYIYSINSGTPQTSNCFSNLAAGAYTLTITDAIGCTYDIYENVSNPSFLNYPTTTDALCNGGGGSANFTLGGTYAAPVTFTLMPGNISNSSGYFSNLSTGTYTMTAIDANNCSNQKVFYIGLSTYLGTLNYTATPGSITLSNAGLTAPIQYTFNNLTSNSNVFSGFCSGNYYISATDVNGCYKVSNAYLSSMTTFPGSTVNANVVDQYCPASNTGSIDVIVNPSGTYTYEMMSPSYINNGSLSLFSSLNAGQYDINIFDASNNCVSKTYNLNTLNNTCGVVNGKVFHDVNNDCAYSNGELNLNNQLIILAPGNHMTYTNPNGQFQFYNKSFNAYNLLQIPSAYFAPSQTCGTTFPLILNTGNTTEYREFADTLYNTNVDMAVYVSPTTFVPGFSSTFKLLYYNPNPYVQATGTVSLILDPNLTFVSSNPMPNSVSGNVLTWNYANFISSYTNGDIYITAAVPTTVPINTPISNCGQIVLTSSVDNNLINNNHCANTIVVSSFDPNEIIVSPHGIGTQGYIGKTDSILTYRINFQNTGTAAAHRVMIIDSLPKQLQLRKFKVIDFSHMYSINVNEQGVMSFVFDNIMLPDSNSNEPESHGYITYQIQQQPNLKPGDQFTNQAHIYFDYNAPVATNKTLNTIKSTVGVIDQTKLSAGLYLSPNPCNDQLRLNSDEAMNGTIDVLDVQGRLLKSYPVSKSYNVSVPTDTLPEGVYLVRYHDMQRSVTQKFVVQHP